MSVYCRNVDTNGGSKKLRLLDDTDGCSNTTTGKYFCTFLALFDLVFELAVEFSLNNLGAL